MSLSRATPSVLGAVTAPEPLIVFSFFFGRRNLPLRKIAISIMLLFLRAP
jgi:hypothetical protein